MISTYCGNYPDVDHTACPSSVECTAVDYCPDCDSAHPAGYCQPVDRCTATRTATGGVTRRCERPAGHVGTHEAWATGPAVTAGILWDTATGDECAFNEYDDAREWCTRHRTGHDAVEIPVRA